MAEESPPLSRHTLVIIGVLTGAVLAICLFIGIMLHRTPDAVKQRAHDTAVADSVPRVTVVQVARAPQGTDLALPATLQANHEAQVYARASGYIKEWYADIGRRVHAGQLLAVIEAPDLDQQLAQARQMLANANATRVLNSANLDRWKVLYRDSSVTQQELDTYQSSFDASRASESAAEDEVRRLEVLVQYEKVTAPFGGVVTARNVETGVFVTATGTTNSVQPSGVGGNTIGGSTPGTQLFTVSQTDTIRAYVGVPQAYAPEVRLGMPAELDVQESPGRTFHGRVIRTANSVDAASRTLLTEVDVVNADGSLLPGTYGDIHFRFQQATPPILMPGTALIFRTSEPQAAVVGADSALHFRNLHIGRDFGTVMEVDSGLVDGDEVVAQPSDVLTDDQKVHAVVQEKAKSPPAQASGSSYRPPHQFREGSPGSGE